MKKLLALALLSSSLLAVDTTQIKLKTDGGAQGDASHALVVAIARSTTAPASPVTGQLWLDSNYSPAILKNWNGSAWASPQVNAAIQTQADTTSFPGSPVDGQVFYSKSPKALYVYDSTAAAWATFALPMVTSAANIRDVYTAATMTDPTGTITATNSATAGSTGAGAYSWRITCRNVNGGETTVGTTTSNTITPGLSKSADLSGLPLCSTATGPTPTNRGIYRSKSAAAGGPWYWVGNIADNSTTTYHDGAADGVGLAPDLNFSAALPGAWAVLNVGTSGGCGGTGSVRGSMVCYNGANAGISAQGGPEASLRASLSIAAYTSGNLTLQYRVKQLSQNGDTYLPFTGPVIFGVRNGTADNAQRLILANSGPVPFTSSVHGAFQYLERITVGAAPGNVLNNAPYPEIDGLPIWVRWVRRGATALSYLSSDGVNWTPSRTAMGADQASLQCSFAVSTGASTMDHVEIPAMAYGALAAGAGPWVEIQAFTVQVDP